MVLARAGRRPLALALLVLVCSLLLVACRSTGASGPGTATITVPAPTPLAVLTQPELDQLVKEQRVALRKASRTFDRCDATSYISATRCLAEAAALTKAASGFVAELEAVVLPPWTYQALLSDLQRLARSGDKVAKRCRKAADPQACDQALARMRADQQSVLWALDS